jgi:hypothetical protein
MRCPETYWHGVLILMTQQVRAELVGIIKAKASGAGSDSSSAKSVYYTVLDNPILPAPEKALLGLSKKVNFWFSHELNHQPSPST